jgi:hypothetical protein
VETGNQRRCNCGLYDCVEQYASATGIVKTAIELRRGRETELNQLNIITAKDVLIWPKLEMMLPWKSFMKWWINSQRPQPDCNRHQS